MKHTSACLRILAMAKARLGLLVKTELPPSRSAEIIWLIDGFQFRSPTTLQPVTTGPEEFLGSLAWHRLS